VDEYSQAFRDAIAILLAHEGGLVDNPADPGGLTNFGITQRSYPDYNVRQLTRVQAVDIYFRDFWAKYRLDRLPPLIGAKVLDIGVNTGMAMAIKFLHQALHACGAAELAEDGQLGDQTVALCHQFPELAVLAAMRSETAGYYRSLAGSHHALIGFLHGWLRRAYA
jgi:lysozyme family protein